MNKENMLKVAEYIENAPKDQFHMGAWFGRYVEDYYDEEDPDFSNTIVWEDAAQCEMIDVEEFVSDAIGKELNCGTTACIAGWAATAFYYEDREAFNDYLNGDDGYYSYKGVENFAKEYLDLNDAEANALFFCTDKSIWSQVKNQYGFQFHTGINESWDIDNKHVADVLRRVANNELSLTKYNWVNLNSEI